MHALDQVTLQFPNPRYSEAYKAELILKESLNIAKTYPELQIILELNLITNLIFQNKIIKGIFLCENLIKKLEKNVKKN